jgi:DUF1680 family protein
LNIRRHWAAGDAIQLQLAMNPQVLAANPRVADDTDRVAIQRGPLIYCLEGVDQPDGVELSAVALRLGKQPNSEFQTEFRRELLDGMVVLHHSGFVRESGASSNVLYPRYNGEPAKNRGVTLTFIPYYAWANRTPTAMQVWTPVLAS